MKTITKYECEICRKRYDDKQDAIDCENKSVADPNDLPKGLMFQFNHNGFVGIFAIAEVWVKEKEHKLNSTWWACRISASVGDSLGSETCGNGSIENVDHIKKHHRITKEHEYGPEFSRMVKYLKKSGLNPQYYNQEGKLRKITFNKATA